MPSATSPISAQQIAGYGVAAVAAVLVLYPVFFLFQAALDVGDPQVRPPTAYGFVGYRGRRLLSILELLGPFLATGRLQQACAALKRHLDTFDELRDTQVAEVIRDAVKPLAPLGARRFRKILVIARLVIRHDEAKAILVWRAMRTAESTPALRLTNAKRRSVRELETDLAQPGARDVFSEDELVGLPMPVQRYFRASQVAYSRAPISTPRHSGRCTGNFWG